MRPGGISFICRSAPPSGFARHLPINGEEGSLRGRGVGCPEHAQVGPLPRLSKSRPGGPREIEDFVRSSGGHLVDLADSGVPMDELLGNAHMPASPLGALQYYERSFFGGTTLMFSSSSCDWSTSEGAPSMRSDIDCVFGNAITSRMLSVPPSIITMRSMPGAMPPCGGTP